MIKEKSLVIYRNHPAVVLGSEGEKINIAVLGGDSVKVREKDIELLHPGPCAAGDLEAPAPEGNAREAWELLAEGESAPGEESGASSGTSLKELAELAFGTFSPRTAWAARELLREGLYFSGDTTRVYARPRSAVEEDEKKRGEKEREALDRAAFLEKLKKLSFKKNAGLGTGSETAENSGPELTETERRFLYDVEALALGKTGKSRTMKELGKSETPEEAHRLLLASGAWTVWENPHPGRFGLGRDSAGIVPPEPPEETRLDLTRLAAYAIDSPWSSDPDDAVSLEGPDAEGRYRLWVHVADPAASILPGSPADVEARGRGATCYLPEGPSRMLAPEALALFALGFDAPASGSGAVCPALSIKITLTPDLAIAETEITPSLVKVTRLSYAEADALINAAPASLSTAGSPGEKDTAETLAALAALAERNVERRLDTGAVMIELPEAHISVSLAGTAAENRVSVEQINEYRSAALVRECMILAGEGTARWALQRRLAFPFISQEAGELPEKRLPGLAGAWQLRRCMRPRNLSARPGVHWGLGLDEYTQVSSPLRRYTDLLCHQQIRASLGSGAYQGREPLGEEEVLFRAAAAEAAASVTVKAERASKAHWLAVYLSGKKGTVWEAVVLDRKGSKGTAVIPALGLETQLSLRGNEEPNDTIHVSLSSAKIPEGEVSFILAADDKTG